MCGFMTFLASRLFDSTKLAAMRVWMAIGAVKLQRPIARDFACGEIGEERQTHARLRLRFQQTAVFPRMAFLAGNGPMCSLQSKPRLIMVEFCFMPAFFGMASLAAAFFHLRRKLSRVRIGMACRALLLRKHEEQLAGQCARALSCMAIAARRR